MSFHKHLIWRVDHDLPDVVVGEQRAERAVASEVSIGAVGDKIGIGDVERPQASSMVEVPLLDLLVDERAHAAGAVTRRDIEGAVFGSGKDGLLDEREGGVEQLAVHALSPSAGPESLVHLPKVPGRTMVGPSSSPRLRGVCSSVWETARAIGA